MSSLVYKIFLIFLLAPLSYASTNELVFQYAGEIGKYSLGIEFNHSKNYFYSFHYGVVPPNGINNKIETYTFKNNFRVFGYDYRDFEYDTYIGISMFHVPGNKYKTHELDGTEDNYYRQSSIRGMVYLGHEVSYRKDVTGFIETGINDVWIINSVNNDTIDYRDHLSMGIGFKVKF